MNAFLEQYGWMLLWAAVIVLALIIEASTAEMVSIWFVPGAVAALVLAIWVDIFWVQLLVFLAISAMMLMIARRYGKKHPKVEKGEELNAEAVIGATGVVHEPIDNIQGTGSVKVGPLEWTARSVSDSVTIPEGTVVVVRELSGVKLICEAVNETPPMGHT